MLIQQGNNNNTIIIRSDRRSVRKVEKFIGSDRHNFRPGIHTLMQPKPSMQVFPFHLE